MTQPDREARLRFALGPLRERFDYILIDTPPSLSLLTVNSLAAADGVLVPMQTEYFALEGVTELLETVERVKGAFNPVLRIEGIVLTMFDERTNLARQVVDDIRSTLGREGVRHRDSAQRPPGRGPVVRKTALAYDIKSKGAEAYLGLGPRAAAASG